MNSASQLGWFLALAVAVPTVSSEAVTVNDGSTTTNLVQLSNANGANGATDNLSVDPAGFLVASQSAVETDFPLRSAWYAGDLAATGAVYTVSADFRPGAPDSPNRSENRGGVMGWLNLGSSNGVALQVIPGDSLTGADIFQVSMIDFSAATASANDSFAHLFNLDGSAASGDAGSAVSSADASYSSTNFATFQLAFSAPTAADLVALSNATAHITAKVYQGTNAGAPSQVSQTIELLTDLAVPGPAVHRFGFFALWGSSFGAPDDVIGDLDNLSADGEVGSPANSPPTVIIRSPPEGATFTEPAAITIMADPHDADGMVSRVDFFADARLLGTVTNNPYNLTWSNVVAGSYALTALVTDNAGATATSSVVNITVSASTGTGPTLTIVRSGDTLELSWPTSGYQLQVKTNLSSSTWIDVPNTSNANHATVQVTGDNMFFRLMQVGGSGGGPSLTIQSSGNSIVISWPAEAQTAGYRLEAKDSLSTATWTSISTTSNQFSETIGLGSRFYRLTKP